MYNSDCKPLIKVRDEQGNRVKFNRNYDSQLRPQFWGEEGKGKDDGRLIARRTGNLLVELYYQILGRRNHEGKFAFVQRANDFLAFINENMSYAAAIEDFGSDEPLKMMEDNDLDIHILFSDEDLDVEDKPQIWGEGDLMDEWVLEPAKKVKTALKGLEYYILSVQGREKCSEFEERADDYYDSFFWSDFRTTYQEMSCDYVEEEDIDELDDECLAEDNWECVDSNCPCDDGDWGLSAREMRFNEPSCCDDEDDWGSDLSVCGPPCMEEGVLDEANLDCDDDPNICPCCGGVLRPIDWSNDDFKPDVNDLVYFDENNVDVWHPCPGEPVDKVENFIKLRELARRVYCAIVEYNGGKFMFSLENGEILLPLKVKNIKGTKLALTTLLVANDIHPLDTFGLLDALMEALRELMIGDLPYKNFDSSLFELGEVLVFLENLEAAAIRYCKKKKIDSNAFNVLPGLWDNLTYIEDYITVG